MRAAPLAVWGHRLTPTALAECAVLDASLSHPNPTCGEASAAYVVALACLIAQPGDAAGALAAASAWAEEHAGQWMMMVHSLVRCVLGQCSCLPLFRGSFAPSCKGFGAACRGCSSSSKCWSTRLPAGQHEQEWLLANCSQHQHASAPSAHLPLPHPPTGEEVQEWLLADSQQPLESIHCLESAGVVKHAFTLAFHHLRCQTPFVEGIELTLCRVGGCGCRLETSGVS